MKTLLLIAVLAVLSSYSASADAGISAVFPSGESSECVRTSGDVTAREALDRSSFNPEWSDEGSSGRVLCRVNGEGSEKDGASCAGSSWNLYARTGSGWSAVTRRADSYEVAEGSMIAFVYENLNLPDAEFSDVCAEQLEIERVTAELEDDDDLKPGERFTVAPGEDFDIEVRVRNAEKRGSSDLADVYVEVTVSELAISEGKNVGRLDAGKTDTVSVDVEVDDDEDNGVYDLKIRVEGRDEKGKVHFTEQEYRMEVERKRHNLLINDVDFQQGELECGRQRLLTAYIKNKGSRSEASPELRVVSASAGYRSAERINEIKKDGSETVLHLVDFSGVQGPGIYEFVIGLYDSVGDLNDDRRIAIRYAGCRENEAVQAEAPKKSSPKKWVVRGNAAAQEPQETDEDFRVDEQFVAVAAILLVAFNLFVVLMVIAASSKKDMY